MGECLYAPEYRARTHLMGFLLTNDKLNRVLGRFFYPRLRRVLLDDFRRLWTRDVQTSTKELRQSVEEVKAELATLRRAYRRLLISDVNHRDASVLATVDERFCADRIRAHIDNAIARAVIVPSPAAHLIIEGIFPQDFYELLTGSIPPAELFPERDPVKQDFEMDTLEEAPLLTRRVWRFFDDEVVGHMLSPAIFARLRDAVVDRYAETGGRAFGERAYAIPHRSFSGRIQLRRPGYHLRPHLDPQRVAITGLIYFARLGDSDAYGTQFFRVDRPVVASGTKTFFPEGEGVACELALTVPFRPNTLIAFVNAGGAHGATLPVGAPLKERYSYQFYVKPDDNALKALLRELPEEARVPWAQFLAGAKLVGGVARR